MASLKQVSSSDLLHSGGVPELGGTVMTAKAAVMIHLLVGKEPLHGVNSLLTPKTDLSCWQLKLLFKNTMKKTFKTNSLYRHAAL